MRKLKRMLGAAAQRVMDWGTGNGRARQDDKERAAYSVSPEMAAIIRRCGAESCVLLKNDGALPLKPDKTVAVFGRCQLDWFFVGYGSGGDVRAPYRVNLMDGMQNAGASFDLPTAALYRAWCESDAHRADDGWWGHWPMSHPEMPLTEAQIGAAAGRADTALVVIGRAAGEDRESTLTPGSYYLTDDEKAMLSAVTAAFAHTVVLLDIGSVTDMRWIEEYGDALSAVLLCWLGGMESGNAVCDVLYGRVSPCGKLADTIARSYTDYPSSADFGGRAYNNYVEDIFVGHRYFSTLAPEKVLYPFGFGLSYTSFAVRPVAFAREGAAITATVEMENSGAFPGSEVAQLWCEAPRGKLAKPARVLAAYAKTRVLAPGESERVTLRGDCKSIASFDDTGASGHKYAFVLEPGSYDFSVNGTPAGGFSLAECECVEQCAAVMPPQAAFARMTGESLETGGVDLKARILRDLPKAMPAASGAPCTLLDVAEGRASLERFIAQLSDAELEALTRGEGNMNSLLGVSGNAGAFGGILPSLREKGVPPVITADGPAGLRLKRESALIPCGTALACMWNDALTEALFAQLGKEMRAYGVDVILSPGMNIHRNPLCGRNFEYFSEDPLLAGKTAAAAVRGVQSEGVSCCPKHFACNNQEVCRNTNDSRVSQRALREIYLRGFEICVKEAAPNTLMSSYNRINGVWSHYNYDLLTTVLRGEWGFEGVVLTDWWMRKSRSPEFPLLRDNAYRVRAQADVLMPGDMGHIHKSYHSDGSLLESLGREGGITRAELQRTAETVLRFILKTKRDALQKENAAR